MQAEEAETGEPLPEKNVPGDVLKLDKQVQIKVLICSSVHQYNYTKYVHASKLYHDNIFSKIFQF